MDESVIKVGKFAEVIRPLTIEEYASLKESVAKNGVLVPIEVDEKGCILDGHNRFQICEELGIKNYQTVIRPGLTDKEKRNHVITLNYDRRHMTKDEQQMRIEQLREEGKSTRQIAERVGVDHSTVVRKLSTGAIAPVDRIVGKDGRSRPARRPAIIATNRQEQKRALDAVASNAKLPDKMISTNRASRLAREHKAELMAEEAKGDIRIGKATLLLGDAFGDTGRIQDVPEGSVDLIFTDPPYDKKSLPLYEELALAGNNVLKPGGLLITYCGCMYIPDVLATFNNVLDYVWTVALVLPGNHSRVHVVSVTQGWKPIIVFQKHADGQSSLNWMEDTFTSEGVQKDGHDWQQSVGCAKYYIRKLLPKGGTVLDPFLGSGTTGRAALDCGCDFVGIEIEAKAFAVAQKKLQNDK